MGLDPAERTEDENQTGRERGWGRRGEAARQREMERRRERTERWPGDPVVLAGRMAGGLLLDN